MSFSLVRSSFIVSLALVPLGSVCAQSGPHQFVTPITIPFYTGADQTGIVSDIAVADLDGDGKPDLIVGNLSGISTGPFLSFLKGNGDGTFAAPVALTNAVQTLPTQVQLADVNGDGRPDLVVTIANSQSTSGNELDVYLGNGNGTFQAPQRYLQGKYIAGANSDLMTSLTVIADLNGDGKPDLAVLIFVPNGPSSLQTLFNDGDGKFTLQTPYTESNQVSLLGAGDFYGHGRNDLLVYGYTDGYNVQVLENNGKGSFTAGPLHTVKEDTSYASHPVAILDVNHDGRPDVILNNLQVLLGEGNGTFRTSATLTLPAPISGDINIVAGDLNGDGNPDFIAGSSVFLGKGDGTFTIDAAYSAYAQGGSEEASTEVGADLNGDGHIDLIWNYQSIYIGASIEVALGSGDGSYKQPFSAPLETIPGESSYIEGALATGDFNRDGIADVAVGCSKGYAAPNAICVFTGSGLGYLNPVTRYNLVYNGSTASVDGGLAVGDVNGDGIPDIVATNENYGGSNQYDTIVLLGKGDGTFKAPQFSLNLNTSNVGFNTLLVDVNHDGKLDLVGSWGVALGNGDGTFQPAVPFPADVTNVVAIVTADFNGDGNPDFAVIAQPNTNSTPEIDVLYGNGTGVYATASVVTTQDIDNGLAVADVNKDGKPDLLYGGFTGKAWALGVLLNKGTSFAAPVYNTFQTGFDFGNLGVFAADFDQDGNVDAVITEQGHFQYFHGLGGGKFAAPVEYAIDSDGQDSPVTISNQIGILDLNGDGYPDIASVDIGGSYGVIRVINAGANATKP